MGSSHKIDSHEVNSYEINSPISRDQLPLDQLLKKATTRMRMQLLESGAVATKEESQKGGKKNSSTV